MPGTLILGLGNTLLADDGVGIHVIRALQSDSRVTREELLDGGTLGFRLADRICGRGSCIVIDATELERPAGTVQILEWQRFERLLSQTRRADVHQAGLLDLASLLKLEGKFPQRFSVVAIQPQTIEWSDRLTPPLQASLPLACNAVVHIAQQWRAQCDA